MLLDRRSADQQLRGDPPVGLALSHRCEHVTLARRQTVQRVIRAGATVAQEAASHSIYFSQPRATAELIKQAAQRALVETPQAVG